MSKQNFYFHTKSINNSSTMSQDQQQQQQDQQQEAMLKENPHTADYVHPMSWEDFRHNAHQTVDFIVDYYKNLEQRPVLSQVKPGYLKDLIPTSPPQGIAS